MVLVASTHLGLGSFLLEGLRVLDWAFGGMSTWLKLDHGPYVHHTQIGDRVAVIGQGSWGSRLIERNWELGLEEAWHGY